MKKNLTFLLQFILSITATQSSISQSEKFGQMIYTPPPGWKETKYQNSIELGISPAPKELLIIDILPAMNFSGTMEQAFEKSYDETCAILQVTKMTEVSGKNYSAKEAKKSFKGWEYIRGSGGIQVNNGTPYPDEYGLELFVIKVNNRFERIAIVKSRNTCSGLSRYYPSDRLSYRNTIENFLFSLQFSDWTEPTLKQASVKGDGVVGVWQGLSMSVGVARPGAELGALLKEKQLLFFSNGQAYFGTYFPVEGLDELNTWIAAENNRRDWGTYTFNNGKGILKMPYGDIPLRLENGKLIISTNKTDHGFIKNKPVDGAKLNGTYSLDEWNGKIPSVTFTSDGKFIDNGAIRVLYHEYTDCLNPAIAHGAGKYEIKNYSLIFNYSDGRKIKIAISGNGFDNNVSDPSTIILSFNGDVMKKQ